MLTYSRLQCMHGRTHTHTHTHFGTCLQSYTDSHINMHEYTHTHKHTPTDAHSIVTVYARANCLSGAFCFAIMCFLPLLPCLNGDTVQPCVCVCVCLCVCARVETECVREYKRACHFNPLTWMPTKNACPERVLLLM